MILLLLFVILVFSCTNIYFLTFHKSEWQKAKPYIYGFFFHFEHEMTNNFLPPSITHVSNHPLSVAYNRDRSIIFFSEKKMVKTIQP